MTCKILVSASDMWVVNDVFSRHEKHIHSYDGLKELKEKTEKMYIFSNNYEQQMYLI